MTRAAAGPDATLLQNLGDGHSGDYET